MTEAKMRQKASFVGDREAVAVTMQVPVGSLYLQVLTLIGQGMGVGQVARVLRIKPGHVGGIVKSAKMRAARMRAADCYEEMDQKSKEAIMRGLEPGGGVHYPEAKIGVAVQKGLGKFKVGDGSAPVSGGGNQTIINRVLVLMNSTAEEKEALLEQWRREALGSRDAGARIVPSLGVGAPEGERESTVVVEELHKDV